MLKKQSVADLRYKGFFHGLRWRMILSFGLLFSVILAGMELVEIFGVPFTPLKGKYDQRKAEVFRNLSLVADLKKERLELWLKERLGDSKVLSGILRTGLAEWRAMDMEKTAGVHSEEFLKAEEKTLQYLSGKLSEKLAIIKDSYGIYEKIKVADHQSGIVIASAFQEDMGTVVYRPDLLRLALESKDSAAMDIGKDPVTGETLLYLYRSIQPAAGLKQGEDEGPLGILAANININDIVGPILFTGEGLGGSGEVVLVDQDAKIITRLKHPLPGGTMAVPLQYQIKAQPAVKAARGEEEGIIEDKDYRGEPVLAAYRHIHLSQDVAIGMVVKQDQAEVFAQMRRTILHSSVIGLAGVILAMGLTFLIAGRLSRPIMELSRAAQRVEAGDLTARADVRTSGEVGLLADSFNSMVQKIQDWQGELEGLNRQLTAKNKELGDIVYVVSHDLRSPLVNVQGFSKELEAANRKLHAILQREDFPLEIKKEIAPLLEEDMPEALQFILRSVSKMDSLLMGLLRLSRLGRQALGIKELDMNKLLAKASGDFEFRLKESGTTLTVDALPPCKGDEMQLNMVFSNLLDNALKYLDKGRKGVIRVSGKQEEGQVRYCVEDNGIGISPEHQAKVFEIFHRLNPGDSPGEGLGLTIVRKVLESHGGRIWVESAKGAGSKFYISLPE
ncbi:MAG: HAMP domain-containing protein [Nitrospinae bacterium]|nr:HAMP domain-containing protein [Nitrospinota bacterium]